MNKSSNLISSGLIGIVAGAGILLNGCGDPKKTGPELLQIVMGVNARGNRNLTHEQRAFLLTGEKYLRDERRNRAIERSGTTIIYNNPVEQEMEFNPDQKYLFFVGKDIPDFSSIEEDNYLENPQLNRRHLKYNEPVLLGDLIFNCPGKKAEIVLLTPSGRELKFGKQNIRLNKHPHYINLDPDQIEKGRNTLRGYINGREVCEFDFYIKE